MRLLYIAAAIAALFVVGYLTAPHSTSQPISDGYSGYSYGDTPKYDGGSYGSDIKYGDGYSYDGGYDYSTDTGGDQGRK